MKILIICLNGDHPRTGYAARVMSNIKSLVDDNVDVAVLRLVPAFHKSESWAEALSQVGVSELAEVPVPPISRFALSRFMAPLVGWMWFVFYQLKWRACIVLAEGHEAASAPLLIKIMPVIVDLHGAGPEEAAYSRHRAGLKDLSIVDWLNRLEIKILHKADAVLVVTSAMKRHLGNKWHDDAVARVKLVPIALNRDFTVKHAVDAVEKYSLGYLKNKNVFVYCGGGQSYQCVDEVISIFECILEDMAEAYLLLITPDVDVIKCKIKNCSLVVQEKVVVVSAKPDEVPSLLRLGRYGFVLREDNVLNKVACPTKINEYLACGLVLICTESSGHGPEAIANTGAGIVIPLEITKELGAVLVDRLQKCYLERNDSVVSTYLSSLSHGGLKVSDIEVFK